MTKSLREVQQIIENELSVFIDNNDRKSGIYKPISYLLSAGGKRIRPAMSVMAANLFTDDLTHTIKPALAIEVFHNFTLMHDDIMDNAPLRRGFATVHEKWNTNTAILSGDAMLIQSYQLLTATRQEWIPELIEIFNTTGLEVCEGQQMDMEFETRAEVHADEYLEMIRLKTSVLLAGAMEIGAVTGGADHVSKELVYEFGENLGMAFQLRDDFLDAFGDPAKTGKQPGGDIRANKKTLLVIRALEKADGPTAGRLRYLFEDKNQDPDKKVREVLAIFDYLNLRGDIENLIAEYDKKALQKLEQIPVDAARKMPLFELTNRLLTREY